MGRQPDWEVFQVREIKTTEDKQPKKIWTKLGVLFVHERGESMTLYLDALPFERELVLLRPKEKEVK